jgi:Kinesin motor domain
MNNFNVDLACYMVELYKVDLRDLLLPKNAAAVKLDIKENPANGMIYLPGVTEKRITSIEEATTIF